MATYDQDSDVIRWGLSLLDGDPPLYSGYYGEAIESSNNYQEQYIEDRYDITDSNHVENDEIIARTLQEDFSQLAVSEASGYSVAAEEYMQPSVQPHDWQCPPTSNHYSNNEYRLEEADDTVASTSCSSRGNAEEYLHSPEYSDDNELDDEVGKTLNQMIPIPHVPRINGEIPSIDEAASDHDRLINRLQLFGFVEHKVEGDGNCQFRALADQIYQSPEHHKTVRRHVVNQVSFLLNFFC
ncbi:hypothetical protein K2173_001951 [Erythroxylum novogranatense]|uniref:OTU domain-containing protein n=1 Tax=Erythroxylum novogranatense TaxID=1862640 RepID=A0AAV8SQ02_9ROSI|nr:hypothetical protein K2173_001951 [Erythroxylum novogranatense]